MGLFNFLNLNVFRPLAGRNRLLFAELLNLLWAQCNSSADYSLPKGEAIHLAEEFLQELSADLVLAESDDTSVEQEPANRDPHQQALWFLNQLKSCGWIEENESGYEEDSRIGLVPQVVPLLQAMDLIVHPRTVTYSGKLYKAYQLLMKLDQEPSPYENILKEVHGDMDELNNSLRNLNASIGTFIDRMTKNKTPQEVLDLFEQYEEQIVVAAYQRFKTSDNLFNYRDALLAQLDACDERYFDLLVQDYCRVEKRSEDEGSAAVARIIDQVKDALNLMRDLISEIDKNHILYRQRAVQRAQFMLMTDGTTQGRINALLRFYSETITGAGDLSELDTSPLSRMWRIYPAGVLGRSFLKTPSVSRSPTPIEPMQPAASIKADELRRAQALLLAYARNAVTQENVNAYAGKVLKTHEVVSASYLASTAEDDFIKLIALHTYSNSDSRNYEIELQDRWVCVHGFRFQEFLVKRKV